MKRALAMALVMLSVSAEADQFRRWQRNAGQRPYAFFELAPASGAGMGAACACAAVTGAAGEAVTWARASSGYCTKEGLATTGLTTTSMVSCGNNLPRVESNGSSLGVLVEAARTNVALRSEEWNSAPWGTVAAGGGTIGVTANQATTPWNAATADQIAFSAVTAGVSSQIYQDIAIANGSTYQFTLYVRGSTGGLTQYMWIFDGTTDRGLATCTYVTATWTRCSTSFTSTVNGTGRFHFGNNRIGLVGSSDTVASTVFVTGAQVEVGPYATSYIATGAASATRALETAVVTLASVTTNTVSFAASVYPEATTAGAMTSFATVLMLGTNVGILSYPSGSPRTFASAATSTTFIAGLQRFYGYDDNALVGVGYGSNTNTAAAGAPATRWSTSLYVGRDNGGSLQPDAILSAVCVDPSPTRCR